MLIAVLIPWYSRMPAQNMKIPANSKLAAEMMGFVPVSASQPETSKVLPVQHGPTGGGCRDDVMLVAQFLINQA